MKHPSDDIRVVLSCDLSVQEKEGEVKAIGALAVSEHDLDKRAFIDDVQR